MMERDWAYRHLGHLQLLSLTGELKHRDSRRYWRGGSARAQWKRGGGVLLRYALPFCACDLARAPTEFVDGGRRCGCVEELLFWMVLS
jgi:hypothetical protein